MKRLSIAVLALLAAGVLNAAAQETGKEKQTGAPRPGTEDLSHWQWYQEVSPPEAGKPLADFLLTPGVFDRARQDLADLRLYDRAGREVPYALRVRRTQDVSEPRPARQFNQVTHPDRSVEVSLDLGEAPADHNEVEVVTAGSEFRRRCRVDGSDDSKEWRKLAEKPLVRFAAAGRTLEIRRVSYPTSRFRYLRVRVFPDAEGNDEPKLSTLTVFHTVRVKGDYTTLPAILERREPVPGERAPGSAWDIRFGDNELAPCESLTLDIADEEFARPYRVEIIDPDGQRYVIAQGELRRRPRDERKPLVIHFPETTERRLRLVVTDSRNPPLNLMNVSYSAAARQVIFKPPQDGGALKLYFGNSKAVAPAYDFAANLPQDLEPAPARTQLVEKTLHANPDFRPEPKPWSERWPWLVYVVLGIASAVLLGLLGLLGREAIARHDAAVP